MPDLVNRKAQDHDVRQYVEHCSPDEEVHGIDAVHGVEEVPEVMDGVAWDDGEQNGDYAPSHDECHDDIYTNGKAFTLEESPIEEENRYLDHGDRCAVINLRCVLELLGSISMSAEGNGQQAALTMKNSRTFAADTVSICLPRPSLMPFVWLAWVHVAS